MENTRINRQKFMAIYFGCNVFRHNAWTDIKKSGQITGSTIEFPFIGYLQLAPLSSITDQDAISVFNIKTFADLKITREPHSNSIRVNYDYWADSKTGFVSNYFYVDPESITHECALKLIAMGYYVGHGKEIEYGWVKLKDKEESK